MISMTSGEMNVIYLLSIGQQHINELALDSGESVRTVKRNIAKLRLHGAKIESELKIGGKDRVYVYCLDNKAKFRELALAWGAVRMEMAIIGMNTTI